MTWLPAAHTSGEALFQRVFLDETGVGLSGLRTPDGPPRCGWASSNQGTAWIAANRCREGGDFDLSARLRELGPSASALEPGVVSSASASYAFGLRLERTPLALGLQLSDSRTRDFAASRVT